MFLKLVTPNRTEVPEIDGSPNPIDLLAIIRFFGLAGVPSGVNSPRLLIEPVCDWTREEYGDDQTDEHFDPKEDEAEEKCKMFSGRKSPNQGDVRHVLVVAVVLDSEERVWR